MSPEQKRIKIAEACGWAIVGAGKGYPPYANKDRSLAYPPHKLPDYLNDLNAMHEAESTLNLNQWDAYESHLKSITTQAGVYSPIRATAAQRAEAFPTNPLPLD